MSRRVALVLSVVAALVLVAAGFYVARNPERKTLDAAARAGVPGSFVRLSDGITQYDLSGSETGRVIVLLSGASVPFYIWDSTSTALAANGFRVLRYNYYGRGYSDRPDLRYDLATYDRQLTDLLDALGLGGRVDVAGLSMGGPIAANFADRHPERVRTLTLVDPAFSMFSRAPLAIRAPVVGKYLLTVAAAPGMAKGQYDDFLHPERYPDWATRYEVQMQYKGFLRSLLQSRRGDVLTRPASSFTSLARSGIPVLLLWGKQDHTVPLPKSDSIRSAFPRAEFHAIDSAGHLPNIEEAAQVDSILISFLRAHV
ncbi:MAG TPA: alpha/beta hydrolase [Gemmatimonadaceae bacterium]